MLVFISAVCQHGCVLSGWRVGWAIGPACIVSAIRNIHIKITDSAPAPFQEAALTALRSPLEYFERLRRVRLRKHYSLAFQFDCAHQLSYLIKCLLMIMPMILQCIFVLLLRIMNQEEITPSSCLLGLDSRFSLSRRVHFFYLWSFLRIVCYLMYVSSLLSLSESRFKKSSTLYLYACRFIS